ncbi:islet amyloid polypeptide [Platysternon megacephalum]|uniref:Islet amyloid polypeptide n=1 Tax=Platysternon megacephalum TaxID=55544 RepID=A0A4D9EL15_9SAUR|nr:islet amyloid polypeptide [Platysternon megacephalum]
MFVIRTKPLTDLRLGTIHSKKRGCSQRVGAELHIPAFHTMAPWMGAKFTVTLTVKGLNAYGCVYLRGSVFPLTSKLKGPWDVCGREQFGSACNNPSAKKSPLRAAAAIHTIGSGDGLHELVETNQATRTRKKIAGICMTLSGSVII